LVPFYYYLLRVLVCAINTTAGLEWQALHRTGVSFADAGFGRNAFTDRACVVSDVVHRTLTDDAKTNARKVATEKNRNETAGEIPVRGREALHELLNIAGR